MAKKISKSGRRTKKERRPQQPIAPPKRGRSLWVGSVVVTVCVAATVFFFSKPPQPSTQDSGDAKPTLKPPEDRVELPVYRPIRSAHEIVALKEAEARLVDQLLSDFPDHVDALMKKAAACQRNGNALEALVFLKKALITDPRRVDIHMRMAQIAVDRGQLEQAIMHYQQILRLQPPTPDVLSKLAAIFMISGKHDEAIAALKEEVRISPESSQAFFTLGQAYLQQKAYAQARESYEAAIDIDPGLARAYYGLAMAHNRLGNRDQAQTYTERFRALKTRDREDRQQDKSEHADFAVAQRIAAVTYTDIGRMYRRQGHVDKAEGLLKEAAGLDPNNVTCLFELASLYNQSGELEKALQLFKRVSQIQPDYAMSYYMSGILSVRLKQFDDAEEAFNTVIRLTPDASEGYRELAGLHLKTGKKIPQARQLAQKAVELKPSAINLYVLGWACSSHGDRSAALNAAERALALEPDNRNYQLLYKSVQREN